MDQARPKRKPWKSWRDFAAWAQDFSLRNKLLGGFLIVVVLVGLVTSFVGTRLARHAHRTSTHALPHQIRALMTVPP